MLIHDIRLSKNGKHKSAAVKNWMLYIYIYTYITSSYTPAGEAKPSEPISAKRLTGSITITRTAVREAYVSRHHARAS